MAWGLVSLKVFREFLLDCFSQLLGFLRILAAGPATTDYCRGEFCYHTDLEIALIAGKGGANAQLVAIIDRFRL